jgi:uncharacterized caspase-like protein
MVDLELFDSRGAFVMPSEEQINALDAPTRERWAAVRDAAADSEAADAALKAAEAHVTDMMAEVRDAERYMRENFPPLTPDAAIRQFLATERMKHTG